MDAESQVEDDLPSGDSRSGAANELPDDDPAVVAGMARLEVLRRIEPDIPEIHARRIQS